MGTVTESRTDPTDGLGQARTRRLWEQEAFTILLEMQRQDEVAELIPRSPWLILRKGDRLLEYFGGVVLGAIIGPMALLFTFILFNYLLHMEF
jgi:hypothetical protein